MVIKSRKYLSRHFLQEKPAGRSSDLISGYIGETFTSMTHGCEEDNHIMDSTSQYCAYQDPERAGQETELGCENRPRQRACPCYRCKMVSKKDITVCFMVIQAVSHAVGGHPPRRIHP